MKKRAKKGKNCIKESLKVLKKLNFIEEKDKKGVGGRWKRNIQTEV